MLTDAHALVTFLGRPHFAVGTMAHSPSGRDIVAARASWLAHGFEYMAGAKLLELRIRLYRSRREVQVVPIQAINNTDPICTFLSREEIVRQRKGG